MNRNENPIAVGCQWVIVALLMLLFFGALLKEPLEMAYSDISAFVTGK